MQEATIEVEPNLLASNKLKAKEERGSKDKIKVKEKRQASTSKTLAAEDKLDEMSNIIKHLASKMSKLELENRNTRKPIQEGVNRNPTPFRRPFQPTQIL
jgi:N6-adenosine-specific RNA methylase IME4